MSSSAAVEESKTSQFAAPAAADKPALGGAGDASLVSHAMGTAPDVDAKVSAASSDGGGDMNSWGLSKAKAEAVMDATARYKAHRMALAAVVTRILDDHLHELDFEGGWFSDAGTALGAWRDGKMIPHDDDVDLGILVLNAKQGTMGNGILPKLRELIAKHLPEQYEARLVTSYCFKVEVYEPAHGAIPLSSERYGVDTDFHNVTTDITLYTQDPADPTLCLPEHMNMRMMRVPVDAILPTTTRIFEGVEMRMPGRLREFLRCQYGYLGKGAVFNHDTKLYEPGPDAPAADRAEYEEDEKTPIPRAAEDAVPFYGTSAKL